MKQVSVAMATYNGATYILEQLESLAKQTHLPAELVITDDGSTDATHQIIEAFAKTSPFPVKLEKNPQNIGWKANFMKAAALCTSEFIAFCDQDDVWLPTKLETCLAKFETDDVLLVYHNATVVDETLKPIGEMDHSATSQAINFPQSIEPWKTGYGYTLVFRNTLLQFDKYHSLSTDYFHKNEKAAHDQWYFFLASALGTIIYIPTHLVLYRRHAKTVTAYTKISAINELMASDLAIFESFQIAAEKRASIMEQIRKDSGTKYNDLPIMAKKGYSKLANYYYLRQKLYLSSNLVSRSCQCIKLVCAGAYFSKRKWGVGYKALGRDIICGVLLNTGRSKTLGSS